MKIMETLVNIPDNRQLLITFPKDMPIGKCKLLIVVEENIPKKQKLRFSNYPIGLKDHKFTFRREDLYGDR